MSRSSPTLSQLEGERAQAPRRCCSTPSPSSGSRAALPPSSSGARNSLQFVDLAGVEERPREVRSALEQHGGDAHRAELVERRAHARRLVFAGCDDHLHAGGFERVGLGAGGRARDDDRQRDLGGGGHQLGGSAAGARASRTRRAAAARSGSAGRPAGRAVSCGSSASAVPMPTTTASTDCAPAMRQLAAAPRR